MASKDELRKYLEAGMKLVEPGVKLGRERAEDLLREFSKDGELGKERVGEWRDHLGDMAEEVLARSRKGTEMLQELVRQEVERQVNAFFKARRDDAMSYARRGAVAMAEVVAKAMDGFRKVDEPSTPATPSQASEPATDPDLVSKTTSASKPSSRSKSKSTQSRSTTTGAAQAKPKSPPRKKTGSTNS